MPFSRISQRSTRQDVDSSRQTLGAIALTLVLVKSSFAGAAPLTDPLQNAPTAISIDADLSLLYADDADTLGTSLTKTNDHASGRPRTLGLRHFALGLGFVAFGASELKATLRPDALIERQVASSSPERDTTPTSGVPFDGRAASPYRDRAPLQFLDTYALRLIAGRSLAVSAGVFDELGRSRTLVDDPLQFGLVPPFPEKSSFVEVAWNQSQYRPMGEAAGESSWQVGITAFQGHRDRSEIFVSDREARDASPGAQDPYLGSALHVSYNWSTASQVSLLAAFSDQSQEVGKSSEDLYELALRLEMPEFLSAAHLLQVRSRLARESFAGDPARKADVDKWYVDAQWLSAYALRHQLFIGIAYGQGEVHQDAGVDPTSYLGFQLGGGYRYRYGERVFLLASAAQENRRSKVDDSERGGFATIDGSVGMVRRFALELRYLLQGGPL